MGKGERMSKHVERSGRSGWLSTVASSPEKKIKIKKWRVYFVLWGRRGPTGGACRVVVFSCLSIAPLSEKRSFTIGLLLSSGTEHRSFHIVKRRGEKV